MNQEMQRYPDLAAGGRAVAECLQQFRDRNDVIVLGLVRGGVPAAIEVASALRLPLDLVVLKRLLVAEGSEDPICAVRVGGKLVLDERLARYAPLQNEVFERVFLPAALEALEAREIACRGSREPLDLEGKVALLVDCGARSGRTVRNAARAIRARGASRVVLALPAAAPETRPVLEASVDEIVCPRWPAPYGNVAVWYSRFEVPDEEAIRGMMDARP